MIKGIGCDIVDLSRLDINNDSLALKILTAKEFEIFKNKKTFKQKKEFLGGRFAGKEAFFKAIGIEKEILNDINGKPYLNYSKSFISLAHENNYAVAYVVIEV